MSLTWCTLSWKELTKEQLYSILALRADVFVVEQECPYLDPDGKDTAAVHLLAYDGEILVGYARIFLNITTCIIGRVVVNSKYRGQKLGRLLLQKSIYIVPADKPIFISAQERLKKFYKSLGFIQTDKGYLEDGIPHIPMVLQPRRANDQ